jgi:hypothetical protein
MLACSLAVVPVLPRPHYPSLDDILDDTLDNTLDVDLGYAVYRGFSNTITGINAWRG